MEKKREKHSPLFSFSQSPISSLLIETLSSSSELCKGTLWQRSAPELPAEDRCLNSVPAFAR